MLAAADSWTIFSVELWHLYIEVCKPRLLAFELPGASHCCVACMWAHCFGVPYRQNSAVERSAAAASAAVVRWLCLL